MWTYFRFKFEHTDSRRAAQLIWEMQRKWNIYLDELLYIDQ